MIKMEVDEQQSNNGGTHQNSTTSNGMNMNNTAAIAAVSPASRMMPMDLSKAGFSLSEAILLSAGRSPLGIAFSTAVGSGTTTLVPAVTSPILISPLPAASSKASTTNCPPPGSNPQTTATADPSSSPPTHHQPRRKSSALLIGPNGQIQVDCLICSDRATGKHYGSISCDGCKGFFRRTIRKKHNYICRFNRSCVVDKNQRNSCRRCRFEKCLANGMRPEAVQLERDRIAATRKCNADKNGAQEQQTTPKQQTNMANDHSPAETNNKTSCENCSNSTPLVPMAPVSPEDIEILERNAARAEQQLQRLMEAERTLRQQQSKREKTNEEKNATMMGKGSPGMAAVQKTATTGDVTDSMHQQLILLVEWAKQLEEFRRLPLRSQIALLRHFSAQHLVICAAFRSMAVGNDGNDAIWLANDRCVPRDAPKIPDVNRVVARILDHLTAPMRRLHLEDREFVALKAVAFFDPMAKDIEPSAVSEVDQTRQRILAAFEHQVNRVSAHRFKMPLRLANLLLLLPPLMAIGRDLVEEAQLAKLFGLANVDELMAELLLPEDAETRSYSRLRTSVTSSIVQSNVTSPTPPTTSPHRHQQQQHFALQQKQQQTSATGQQQQQMIAAPTPIYSPTTPLMLQLGAVQQHHLLGQFNGK